MVFPWNNETSCVQAERVATMERTDRSKTKLVAIRSTFESSHSSAVRTLEVRNAGKACGNWAIRGCLDLKFYDFDF